MSARFLVTVLIFDLLSTSVYGHGRMIEPPQRSSLWRVFPRQGFEPNYNDNELFCGGAARQWNDNGGKCGTCGDPYDGERRNEAGGVYATGFIARRYKKGEDIDVEIQLTANHLGYMQFKICPQNDITSQVTQECLDDHILEIVGQPAGVTKYEPGSAIGSHSIKLTLPSDMTCEQCVIQWHYVAGNNHGCDTVTGVCCKGCGPQETFINCADIAIDDDEEVGQKSSTTKSSTTNAPSTTTHKPTMKAPSTITSVPTTRAPSTPTPVPSTKSPSSPTPAPTTEMPSTTTAAATSKPLTASPLIGDHNPICGADELKDCVGIGVYDGLGYEGWCNTYCGIQSVACTDELCSCNCKKSKTCYALGQFATIPGMDKYCQDTCQDGCDNISHMCSCD